MDNKDKLEKYIKEQVESIEFHEEDKMWQNFSKNQNIPKRSRPSVFWMMMVLIVCSLFYWAYSSDIIEISLNLPNSSKLDTFTGSKLSKNSTIVENTVNIVKDENVNNNTVIDENINRSDDIENKSTELIKNKDTVSQGRNISKNPTNRYRINSKSKRVNGKRSQTISTTNTVSKNQKTNPALNIKSKSKNNDDVKLSSIVPKDMVSDNLNKSENKTNTDDATDGKRETIGSVSQSELFLIAYKLIAQIDNPLDKFSIDSILTYEDKLTTTKVFSYNQFKVEYRLGSSRSLTNYHALGLSYQFLLKEGNAITIGSGIQYGDGYSVSLDSVRTVISMSILETKKYKDLSYLMDAYWLTSYDLKRNGFQLSLGGKVKYGWRNEYEIVERERLQNNQNFNFSNGFSVESKELNDWSPLNKWRFDIFGELSYRPYMGLIEVGVTTSKQLNLLIKDELAAKNQTNNPIQIGLHLKYTIN